MVGILIGNKDSATGLEEILLLREELVIRQHDGASDACRCQINQPGGRGYW
jgi:hypothetical protein